MKQLALSRQEAAEIRRIRRLPFPGKVLVEPGQSVHPEDLIAVAELPDELFSLDIARGLGIDPSEVFNCLVRDLDEELAKDDVIAERDGALPRVVRVPRSGRLLACRDGVAFISAGKRSITLRADMIGEVSSILPERGAVITTQGGLIQGVWGNGRVGAGILRVQPSALEDAMTPDDLEKFDEGQVIAAGFCSEEPALTEIAEKKPTGLILGSVCSDLTAQLMALPFPVIVLQGFGKNAADHQTFTMLRERNGDVVCINACRPDIIAGERPEVIIPNVTGEAMAPLPFRKKLSIGQRVQVLSGTAEGGLFTVVELPEKPVVLESGLTCEVAVLHSDSEEKTTVPRSNLMILGAEGS